MLSPPAPSPDSNFLCLSAMLAATQLILQRRSLYKSDSYQSTSVALTWSAATVYHVLAVGDLADYEKSLVFHVEAYGAGPNTISEC